MLRKKKWRKYRWNNYKRYAEQRYARDNFTLGSACYHKQSQKQIKMMTSTMCKKKLRISGSSNTMPHTLLMVSMQVSTYFELIFLTLKV